MGSWKFQNSPWPAAQGATVLSARQLGRRGPLVRGGMRAGGCAQPGARVAEHQACEPGKLHAQHRKPWLTLPQHLETKAWDILNPTAPSRRGAGGAPSSWSEPGTRP